MIQLDMTQEELREEVLKRAAEKLLAEVMGVDIDDIVERLQTRIETEVKSAVSTAVTGAADRAIAKHVDPYFQQKIEDFVFQQTNAWGEKTGEPKTFREMLLARAEAYITEPVSYDGKTKSQDSYNWKANTTRVAYMVDKHLQYHIESAMKTALAEANNNIAKGLADAVKISIAQATGALKVAVTSR